MRRVDVQRWPAVPTAPKTIARTARSRSASSVDDDGVVAAELEDACGRSVAATTCATWRPTAVEPVNEIERQPRDRASIASPIVRPGADDQREDAGHAVIGHHAVGDVLHRDGA